MFFFFIIYIKNPCLPIWFCSLNVCWNTLFLKVKELSTKWNFTDRIGYMTMFVWMGREPIGLYVWMFKFQLFRTVLEGTMHCGLGGRYGFLVMDVSIGEGLFFCSFKRPLQGRLSLSPLLLSICLPAFGSSCRLSAPWLLACCHASCHDDHVLAL